MSIVRVGMGENKKFGQGHAAIFGKKKAAVKATTPKKEVPKKKAK